jgi:HEPN domain
MLTTIRSDDVFLQKALESLDGAESEYVNDRYNNCANRAYYACFQAALYALKQAGVRSPGSRVEWGHDLVQAQFIGQLINRR